MIAFEEHARLLLVVHAVLGAALVAAATHLVVWTWSLARGRHGRHRGARRFAWITAALFAVELLAGLVLYPSYKVRVRLEYLDEPVAIAEARRAAAEARARVEGRLPPSARSAAPPPADPGRLARASRWFDVKEHGVAVGLALALALAVILSSWSPRRDGDAIAPAVAGMALAAAALVWLAAVVGLWVTSYRSIGA